MSPACSGRATPASTRRVLAARDLPDRDAYDAALGDPAARCARGSRLSGRLHAACRCANAGRVSRPDPEHPPVASAGVPGTRRAATGARARRARVGRDGPPGHVGTGRRADRRCSPRSRCSPTTPSTRCRRASWSKSIGFTPKRFDWCSTGAGRLRAGASYVGAVLSGAPQCQHGHFRRAVDLTGTYTVPTPRLTNIVVRSR